MKDLGLTARIVNYFIDSKLTPVIILVTLVLGLFAILKTPKEEEPQIVVPMIDIMLQYPGAEPKEVEKRVVTPLEKKLWELKDIEYIYSVAKPGMAVVTARFYVGTDPVKALVEINSKWMSAMDIAPPGVILPPLIKPKSIDDVPILSLTLWGERYDGYDLRRMAALLENEIKKLENVAEVSLIGGRPREIRIILDPARLESFRLSPLRLAQILKNANAQCVSGRLKEKNQEYLLQTGEFFRSKEDVENVIVGIFQGRPVYLKDVAKVSDGPSEVKDYVFFGGGPAGPKKGIQSSSELYPAVTIAISKRKGTNAVQVAEEVLELVSKVRSKLLPSDLHVTVTRNYGETSREKANELLEHLFIATFAVTLLIAVVLGWREAVVVGIAVPVTLAIALFLSMLYGFTLNRVTLFALIFCIGILVDDPIVDVENIHRWFKARLAPNARLAIIGAVNEVRAPIILATFTVIAALMPMAFVTGLMGPYMRPIPINASVAMLFSLLVALIITPWAAYRILKTPAEEDKEIEEEELAHDLEEMKKRELEQEISYIKKTKLYQFFAKGMFPFLSSPKKRYLLYGGIIFLLLASLSLFYFKVVLVKMLPYDNKSEVQIVLDMPEGTPLEKTLETAKAIGRYIQRESIVTDIQIYVGTSSPYNFNGLVRHYYLRSEPHQADIQVNLIGKHHRKEQSHDFAKRIRPKVHEIAKAYGAKYVAVVEVPPGPPVLSPIVAEVYAPDLISQENFARNVLKIFKNSPLITDEGIYLEDKAPRLRLKAKEEKLKAAGLQRSELVQTLSALCEGLQVGIFQNTDTEHTPILLKLDESFRTLELLRTLKVVNFEGKPVPLSELVEIKEDLIPSSIYHKNLRRVTYVVGDTGGRYEAPVYGIFDIREKIKALSNPYGEVREFWLTHPLALDKIAVKWDGEMHITLEVFRDLGLAFLGAIFVMYVLILGWFRDFRIPGVIMAPIPLTLFGIIPGHLILNSFFTATSMIGFIALAGIIVRNSILVVDFAEQRVKKGVPLALAVVESAAVRTRPIFLTASGVVVGAFVILFDPIFNGLAISLIFGTIGSTLLSLFLIPLLYYGHKLKRGHPAPSKDLLKKQIFD
ncbi:multidrug transporter AcrB [Caldimicrobium thiodismutans]|uniref:Multidrug transporter AcrB n=1 Tax=Caldimicrobium thiodismutans TaxID=1653476 RepID=A0A0U5AKZ8_9BACT|nr:efflux RND transporter permease subunit [Caldimicrobium thiodismutans]BAU22772.1 multidrug transporter AcrB [Caldimicrobium thiodismutans]